MATLTALDALRIDIERVKRLRRSHKQTVTLQAAETDVGAAFGQRNATNLHEGLR